MLSLVLGFAGLQSFASAWLRGWWWYWWCRSTGRWSAASVSSTARYNTSTSTRQRDRPSLLTRHRTRLQQRSDLWTRRWSPARRCRSTSFQTRMWLSCRRRRRPTSTHLWAASGQWCQAPSTASSRSGRTAPPASGALPPVDFELHQTSIDPSLVLTPSPHLVEYQFTC